MKSVATLVGSVSIVGENVGHGVDGLGEGAGVGVLEGFLDVVGDNVGLLVGDTLGAAVKRAALQTMPSSIIRSASLRFGSSMSPYANSALASAVLYALAVLCALLGASTPGARSKIDSVSKVAAPRAPSPRLLLLKTSAP